MLVNVKDDVVNLKAILRCMGTGGQRSFCMSHSDESFSPRCHCFLQNVSCTGRKKNLFEFLGFHTLLVKLHLKWPLKLATSQNFTESSRVASWYQIIYYSRWMNEPKIWLYEIDLWVSYLTRQKYHYCLTTFVYVFQVTIMLWICLCWWCIQGVLIRRNAHSKHSALPKL